ncbi:MAG: hypothetical protein ABIJ05_01405 [Patescibacteria group bacterium]
MDTEINQKIIGKIEKIKEKKIREFLKEIVCLEFQNSEEGRWPFREEYEKRINKFLDD